MKYIPIMIALLVALGCEEKTPAADAVPEPFAGVPAGEEPTGKEASGESPDASTAEQTPEIQLPNQNSPYKGVVTAGQPTTTQFEKLSDAGYTAVINLRTETENGYWDEKDTATRNRILYNHIPIGGPDDLTRENVDKLAKTMSQPMAKNGKVLVHCGSANRAGAILALKAHWVDGLTPEDSLDIGKRAGLSSLEGAVKERLGMK